MYFAGKLRNFRNTIFIILIYVVCIAIYILFDNKSSILPMRLFECIMAADIVLFTEASFRVRMNIDVIDESDNNEAMLGVTINKRGLYPYKKTEIYVCLTNRFSENVIRRKIVIMPGDWVWHNEQVIFKNLGYGYTDIRIERVYVFDIFSIFCKRKYKKYPAMTVFTMPKSKIVKVDVTKIPIIEADESDIFANNGKGKDSSENFEIREFMDGDSLNKIHWKLSSKFDDLMIKDDSCITEADIYLVVELHTNDRVICAFENIVSNAKMLLNKGYSFYIAYVDKSGRYFNRYLIKNTRDIRIAMKEAVLAEKNIDSCVKSEALQSLKVDKDEMFGLYRIQK